MRTALLVLGALLAAAFAFAFGATFFARDRIIRLAEDYVIDRTREFADPLAELSENAMIAFQERAMGADMRGMRAARQELADYRRDPRAYIANLVVEGDGPEPAEPGLVATPKDQVLFWKAEVRAHFRETLDRLLLDVRIFTGSNLIAALSIVGLAIAGRRERLPRFLPAAGVMLLSVAFMTYVYVLTMRDPFTVAKWTSSRTSRSSSARTWAGGTRPCSSSRLSGPTRSRERPARK